MSKLSVGVLGPLEVVVDGVRLKLGGPRQERLLGLLLLHANTSMTPAQLIDALWDDGPPDTARNQVHNSIARLRRDLGSARPAVVTDGRSYRLNIGEDQSDSLRFSRSVDRACGLARAGARREAIDVLRAALSLWRGAAFGGLDGRVFESAAAKLAEERLSARELLTQLRIDTHDTVGLIAELSVLSAEHPTRETLVQQLMAVLYREGRQVEALRAYEQLRIRLVDDLGIDPGPELRDLHERILRSDASLMPERPATPTTIQPAVEPRFLPRDVPDFTGRREEISSLVELVETTADTAVIITAIDGMPGIGKTTLAVHIGHLMMNRFPDGQLFFDLHGYTPGRQPLAPDVALDLLLRGIGVPPEQIPDGLERRVDLWRSMMANKQMLVLLDNAADTVQVRPLLPASPGVRVLVTSRRRLTMLEGASSYSLDVLPHEDAARLFCLVANANPFGDEDSDVDEVVTLCGYLPLAIRIAASRLRSRPQWTVAYLADLLRDEGNRLAELAAEDRSVHAAFAVSYQHLPDMMRRSFRLLGLLPGGDFGAHAAAAVTDSTLPNAQRLLEDLVDANLLSQHRPGRYHFHDLIRQFARSICAEDERPQAISRVIAHYLDLGHTAEQVAHPAGTTERGRQRSHALPDLRTATEVRAVIDAEHRNIVEMIDLASAHGLHDETAELAAVFGPILQRQGYLDEALAGYASGLAAATSLDVKATLYRSLGKSLITARRLDASLQALRACLAIEEKRGDDHGAGRAHINIGIVYYRMGRFTDALTSLHHAHKLLSEMGTPRDNAATLVNLCATHIRLGNHTAAIAHVNQVLAACPELGNPHIEAVALFNLGHAQLRSGDINEALDNLKLSRELSNQIGTTEIEARSLYTTAECHRQRHDFTEGLEHARAALILARRIGNRDVQSHALVVLGQIHFDQGGLTVAAGCFHESLRLTADNGDNYTEVVAHDGLARIAHTENDQKRAQHHWRAALARAQAGDLPEAAQIQRELAHHCGAQATPTNTAP